MRRRKVAAREEPQTHLNGGWLHSAQAPAQGRSTPRQGGAPLNGGSEARQAQGRTPHAARIGGAPLGLDAGTDVRGAKGGERGEPGQPGSPGAKGDKGDQGIQGIHGIQGPPGFASTFITTTTFVTNGGSFNSGIADYPDSLPHAIAGGYDVSDSIGNLFNVMQNRPPGDGSGWLVRMRSGAANPFTTEVLAVCVK